MSQSICYWPIAIIFSSLIWIILTVILGPIFLLLWIYKLLVFLCMKLVKSDLEMLSASDSGVVDNIRKKTLYNIGVLFILESDKGVGHNFNGIKVEEMRENFADLFIRSAKNQDGYRKLKKVYRSYGGYYFWENVKNFSIDNHVSEHSIKSEAHLDDFVSNWMKSPYQDSAPMWGMALIKWVSGQRDTGHGKIRCAVTFRIHHSYADGISVLQLAHKLAGTTPSSIPSHVRPKPLGFVRKAGLFFILPYVLKTMMGNIFSAPNPFKDIPAKDDSFFVLTSVPLEVVKKIKRDINVPFATVLMTIVGGIVRRLLKEANSQVDLPEYMYLGSALLYPYRKHDSLCNEWAAGTFKIPIAEENPVERLKVTSDDFQTFMKAGAHLVMKPIMFGLISLVPSGLFHKCINPNKSDTVPLAPAAIMSGSLVGNLNETYRLWGSEVKHVYPIACNADPHLALGCISTSHGTNFDVAIVVDASLFPHNSNLKENLPKYFLSELESLSKNAEQYAVCNGEHTEKLRG